MITSNVLTRTFRIKYRDGCGTCFTVDEASKQYLVTARHVLPDIREVDSVEIFFNREWHLVESTVVGVGHGETDIAVLSLPLQLSPTYPLLANTGNIILGQDVFFLGFPYELFADVGELNRNFPMPLVKRATLSAMFDTADGVEKMYLDGHNNRGFSGGPVVFTPIGSKELRVVGVIAGFEAVEQQIYDGENPTNLVYEYNTGIIISYSIRHAVELIHHNPIGFDLK